MRQFLAVALAALILSCISGCASEGSADSKGPSKAEDSVAWPVNEVGLTYGSLSDIEYEGLLDSEELAALSPQLVLAIGDDGVTEGYVYYSDLNELPPDDPDEMQEWIENREASKTIPLYDIDGVTVIGTFSKSTHQVID